MATENHVSANQQLPPDYFIRSRLRLRQLRLLVALDDHRNLRRAAAELQIAQPAATKMLRETESVFGIPLFKRHPRGMEPNAYGEIMARHARMMLFNLSHAREELSALQAGSMGKVSVGAIMAAVPGLLAQTLARLRNASPHLLIQIQVDTSDVLLRALREGLLDIAIARPTEEERRGFHYELLATETVCVVAAIDHPLTHRRQLALRDLLEWPWILQSPTSPMRRQIDLLFQRAGLATPQERIETANILATMSLLAGTHMLAVVPIEVAQQFAAKQMLRVLPVAFDCGLGSYGIATPEGQLHSPACARFIAVLREEARGHSAAQSGQRRHGSKTRSNAPLPR
jgi:DNA-binding transcriptional LysR family regulator